MALPKRVRAAPRLRYGVFAKGRREVATGELIEETYSRCANRWLTGSLALDVIAWVRSANIATAET